MSKDDVIALALKFLRRTTIEGHEAKEMLLCLQWLEALESKLAESKVAVPKEQ